MRFLTNIKERKWDLKLSMYIEGFSIMFPFKAIDIDQINTDFEKLTTF